MNRLVCLRTLTPTLVTLGALGSAAALAQKPSDRAAEQPRQTPAQQKYGLPRNPTTGGTTDVDLSKPLSLDRAVAIGLQRQNSIAITQSQAEAASAGLTQARSSYWPTITPSLRYNYNKQPGGVFIIGGQTLRGSGVSENRNDNINASWRIFDVGQREANIGQSRRSVFAAEYGLGNERQNVVLSVTEGYYNLLRTKELVRVQEETVRRATTNLEAIKAQVAVGNAAQSDTLQAEADLANAEVDLLSAQNDYDLSQASLKNAMGIVSYDPIIPAQDKVAPPPLTRDTGSLEEYVELAYVNRLDVKQQQERINAQGYNVRLAHLNNGLSVAADITQGYQLDPAAGDTRTLTFSVSYPLFDGGNTRAAVRESKASLEQARRNLDQIQQTVRLNVEQSYRTREQSRLKYGASQKAVQAAQLNYDAALERQRNGLVNVLDVLNAQLQLVNAQVSNVQAIYDYYVADARLKRSIGLNDQNFLPRVPGAKPPRITFAPTRIAPSLLALIAPKTPAFQTTLPKSDGVAGERKP